MKQIINTLFPFYLDLHILQLEEYKLDRFLKWIASHFLVRKMSLKKPLVYTAKIKNIIFIYIGIVVISLFFNFWIFILLLIQPYIGFIAAVLILKPYEMYKRKEIIEKTRNKISAYKNLKVIGITGSFGKSSTKEILYQLLKGKYKTLRTPESFNTILGIARVVDFELDESYEYFICEMAAYKIGEIKEICYMVPPQFGILTGITTQHLERFGSLVNTVKAKFELVDAIHDKDKIVFNLNNENVLNEIIKRKIKNPNNVLGLGEVGFDKNGSNFEIEIKNKKYKVKTALFGFANIKNILAASAMAEKLGVSPKDIVSLIETLKPVDNRFVLQTQGKATIVNNTYSSNPQGFKETVETGKIVKGKKALVTPGLVELGELEKEIHLELGRFSRGVFDKVILVGKNNRTKFLAEGLGENCEFINDTREEYFKKIEELKGKYDWIFLENDVTENY